MATLKELERAGTLVLVRVRLRRKEFPDRRMYAFPEFMNWLHNEVMKATAFYPDDIEPRMQAASVLNDYITGKPMVGSRMFKRLRPATDDVWELRTPDLRFFGWVPQKDVFVAVRGDEFKNLKNDTTLYEKHRIATRLARDGLDLDKPKYMKGAKEHEIVSD